MAPLTGAWSRLTEDEAALRMRRWGKWRNRHSVTGMAQCLNQVLPPQAAVAEEDVQGYLDELRNNGLLRESVERHREVIGKDWTRKTSGVVTAAMLFNFAATRVLRPETIVETGCATGWTSALFLSALHLNGGGHLYSVDLPPRDGHLSMNWTLPEGLEPGFLVPEGIRDRWTLIIGNARRELPRLLDRIERVEAFYHDSDHTYEHMMWEYTTVWPHLTAGGLVISDDIGWNTAAWDFAMAIGARLSVHRSNLNFGAMAKTGAAS